MTRLYMIRGPMQGHAFDLNDSTTSIGRSIDNDIQIDDPSVSRFHAKINSKGDDLFIEDMKSQNGTLIDGKAIPPFETVQLRKGISIALGNILFILGKQSGAGEPVTRIDEVPQDRTEDLKTPRPEDQTIITDRKNLDLIYEISAALLRTLDIGELCEKIMNALFFHFRRIDMGLILLRDQASGEMKEIIARARDKKKPAPGNYSRSVVERVVRQSKAVMISDTSLEKQTPVTRTIEAQKIRSIMCTPLISHGEVRGVIYVHSINVPQGFQKKDLSLLAALSTPATVAIENALLYHKTKRAEAALRKARDELEKRVEERTGELVLANQKLTNEIAERERSEQALRESEERFRNMAASAQDAIISMDNEGRIAYWNEAAEAMFGCEATEAVGRDVHELLAPPHYTEEIGPAFDAWKQTGRGNAVGKTRELLALKKDGSSFPVELSLASVQFHGQWNAVGMVRDITARKKAEAELNERTRDLDIRVKRLDCLYGISKLREKPDSSLQDILQRVVDQIPPAMEHPDGTCARILSDGQSFTSDGFKESSWNLNRPITANDREVGQLEVFYLDEGKEKVPEGPFTPEEKTLIDVIAEQLAKVFEFKRTQEALERAREKEVEIGSRIQQTLLLGMPPKNVPGLSVSTMTIPSQRIDGDFFDFFRQSDQCMDVLIGDVMGKGVPAALLGAAIKGHFVKALSDLIPNSKTLPDPAQIVGEVHKRMVKELINLESFATLCYVRFDLVGRRGELIDCGHTRTIHYHRAMQMCNTIKGYNMPLGFSEEETYGPLSFPLEAGDILFFYSDGITEAQDGNGVFFGEDRLIECISSNAGMEPGALIERVRDDVLAFSGTESFTDDLTCVAVKIQAESNLTPLLHLELEIPSDTGQLAKLRDFVQDLCQRNIHPPFDMDNTWQLGLAANEAATNIMRHAYEGRKDGKIHIVAEAFVDRIVLCFNHWGKAFEPPKFVQPPPVEDLHESGYGLFVIQTYVDDVTYSTDRDGKSSICLVKKRNRS